MYCTFQRIKFTKTKDTRRVTVGWLHNRKRIVAGKGGGSQDIDVDRHISYADTLELFTNIYFPNGENTITGFKIGDMERCFIASYTGQPINDIIPEDNFTFGDLVTKMKSSPVRLYLHTEDVQVLMNQLLFLIVANRI